MRPYQVGMILTAVAVYRHCVSLFAQSSDEAHRLVPTCHCDGEEGYEEPCAPCMFLMDIIIATKA